MNKISVADAKQNLLQLVERVDSSFERLYITSGKKKAVLMGADEFESWMETLASYEDAETIKRLKELDTLKKNKQYLTFEDLEDEFDVK